MIRRQRTLQHAWRHCGDLAGGSRDTCLLYEQGTLCDHAPQLFKVNSANKGVCLEEIEYHWTS